MNGKSANPLSLGLEQINFKAKHRIAERLWIMRDLNMYQVHKMGKYDAWGCMMA